MSKAIIVNKISSLFVIELSNNFRNKVIFGMFNLFIRKKRNVYIHHN